MTYRQAAWVLTATNHGPMIVNRNDRFMTAEDKGVGVGFQLLELSEYERSEVAQTKEILRELRKERAGHIMAFDGGANIGVFTIEWARMMAGWGSVVAFEPQDRIYYALCGNIVLNNLENALALQYALGAEDSVISVPAMNFCKPANFGGLSLNGHNRKDVGNPDDRRETRRGEQHRIDSIGFRVDFLKLDIQGMELEALAGAEHTIQKFHPVLLLEHIEVGRAPLEEWLRAHNYQFEIVGMNILGHYAG